MTKRIVSVSILALVLGVNALSQTAANAKHRVVVQLSEPQGRAWDDLLPHLNNLLANFIQDGGLQMEVVFFGQGVNMLRKTNVAYEKRLKRFAAYGVTFSACQNSMTVLKLSKEDLFPFVSEVRSGVAEVVRKQEAGWAYLH